MNSINNVRIAIITVIITDFWCVRKSHAITLCMYFYHFITIGASGGKCLIIGNNLNIK